MCLLFSVYKHRPGICFCLFAFSSVFLIITSRRSWDLIMIQIFLFFYPYSPNDSSSKFSTKPNWSRKIQTAIWWKNNILDFFFWTCYFIFQHRKIAFKNYHFTRQWWYEYIEKYCDFQITAKNDDTASVEPTGYVNNLIKEPSTGYEITMAQQLYCRLKALWCRL